MSNKHKLINMGHKHPVHNFNLHLVNTGFYHHKSDYVTAAQSGHNTFMFAA